MPDRVVWDIKQDIQGFIWFATANGLSRFDGYEIENFYIPRLAKENKNNSYIKNIELSDDGGLWVATLDSGVFHFDRNLKQFSQPSELLLSGENINILKKDSLGSLWIGTSKQLYQYDIKTKLLTAFKHDNLANDSIPKGAVYSIEQDSNNNLWIGTRSGLAFFEPKLKRFRTVAAEAIKSSVRALVLKNSQLYVGTLKGLYRLSIYGQDPVVEPPKINTLLKGIVLSLSNDQENNLWVGTLKNGLYHLKNEQVSHHFVNQSGDSYSISANDILSIHVDTFGVIWIGSFSAGVNKLDLNTLNFGARKPHYTGVDCPDNSVIHSLEENPAGGLWLGTGAGLFLYDKGRCRGFKKDAQTGEEIPHYEITALFLDHLDSVEPNIENNLYVGTGRGLAIINLSNNQIQRIESDFSNDYVNTIAKHPDGSIWVGTNKGVYKSKSGRDNWSVVEWPDMVEEVYVNKLAFGYNGDLWIATRTGLYKKKADDRFVSKSVNLAPDLNGKDIRDIYLTKNGELWVAAKLLGIVKLGASGQELLRLDESHLGVDVRHFNSLIEDNEGVLWFTSKQGLSRLVLDSLEVEHFSYHHGLQGNDFSRNAVLFDTNGQLIFAGKSGFNRFRPSEIKRNTIAPKVMLGGLKRFNEWVEPKKKYDGFEIQSSIASLKEFTLTHRDSVFSLEMLALHYAEPNLNKYAFKMEGLDDKWHYSDARNRVMTFNNLSPGDYIFKVKAANKDGVWSPQNNVVNITVLAAPWKTIQAYLIYILLIFLAAFGYIKRKISHSKRYAAVLEKQVAERTSMVEEQKLTIEHLLERKNELFANITHEFKTPLTLILGPLDSAIQQSSGPVLNKIELAMKNAKRMLLMVNQLLSLAALSKIEKADEQLEVVQVDEQLSFLVASFTPLAQQKRIAFTYENKTQQVALKLTTDALTLVIGNLLSNAIKYTPIGGEVTLIVELLESDSKSLKIGVVDSGAGISSDDKKKIFQRFTRLSHHYSLPGTGIGLAVVAETVAANGGSIELKSHLGRGAEFITTWPIFDGKSLGCKQSNSEQSDGSDGRSVDERVSSQHLHTLINMDVVVDDISNISTARKVEVANAEINTVAESSSKDTVLVIEDNDEMRQFIVDELNPDYHVLQGRNGREGIAIAIREVPDVVLSDIMMPELDGFQVSRTLRADERTSHIPIILLTAKGDDETRFKGWREQVDDFLTKPFNVKELQLRIRNILNIRSILKQSLLNQVTNKTSVGHGVNYVEQQFLDKIDLVLQSHFHDMNFTRANLAREMAVSERQLQRKLSALLGVSPSDYIRDYRLKISAIELKKGFQVAIVSDQCGFSSSGHFSRCFKAKYGLTPKQYQQSHTGSAS